jgi:hypothetical protein
MWQNQFAFNKKIHENKKLERKSNQLISTKWSFNEVFGKGNEKMGATNKLRHVVQNFQQSFWPQPWEQNLRQKCDINKLVKLDSLR